MNIDLLRQHFRSYPRMQPQDAVKLAFQSAYGCGHLLPDQARALEMIRQEMAKVPERADESAFTLIGNGLCRLHLACPAVRALGAEWIWAMMKHTEEEVLKRSDNDLRFSSAMNGVATLAQKGETGFTDSELRAYLDAWTVSGRPVVSHTEIYREACHPSYRVVLSDYAALLPLLIRIKSGCPAVVIDGPCGSGKSTLACRLAALTGAQPVPMDDFFLPFDMRTEQRLAQPGGNVHYERFKAEILDGYQAGEPFSYQRFDCQTGTLAERNVCASGLLLIEGSYSHHPFFQEDYDRLNALRVYVDVDPAEQLRRIALRNPDLLPMFETRWIPLEKTYFEAYDIKDRAGMTVKSPPWDGA